MPRKKNTAVAEVATPTDTADTSFNPAEFDPAMQEQPAAQTVEPAAEQSEATSFADSVKKKERIKLPNPFSFHGVNGDGNGVHFLREDPDPKRGFPGAWVIRFDKNPNEMEGYSKDNPHPVLKMLKDEGFRWGFSGADDKGGWGKRWQEGHFTYAESVEAKKAFYKAAEMIGAQVDQGAAVG